MKSALRPHQQLIILLLILLIHGSMLLIFIAAEFSSEPHEAIVMMEQDEAPRSDHEWVALNNSLPNTQLAAQHSVPQPEEQSETVAQHNNGPTVEQNALEQHPADQKEQPPEVVAQEKEIDEAIALASSVLEHKKPQEIPQTELKKEPTPEQPTPLTQTSSTPTKHIPTLAELAQGFTQHMQQADMAVHSNRKGVASIDQIKHINYCQKIIGCIVNSYKIHNHVAPKKVLANRARIQLALNRNGSIAQLTLQASSGDVSIDRFLLDMFQDASSSFPPVPAALKDSPYTLPTFSIDSLESFHSTQGWYIDNRSI